jgi:dihydrodipicolinate synthetase family protein
MKLWTDWPTQTLNALRKGQVIPAMPLALDARRKFDPRRQRALLRYYLEAGSGGMAVGVHTTQFEIRDVGLYEPVLRLAAEEMDASPNEALVRIAGLVGDTEQAVQEARIARDLGYHAGLLSLAAWKGRDEDDIIAHCRRVADEIAIVGFYLQPSVGGFDLGAGFWRRFAGIENVVAIKVARFDRYRTLDVMRGVAEARAEDRITLYTGNDDHIVADLVTPFLVRRGDEMIAMRFRGGLLGHWSVWTRKAVEILDKCHMVVAVGAVPEDILALDSQVTDCNAAFFDVAGGFAGCIAGCHEVLRRQGLLEGIWLLDPDEGLSPGQKAEIDRVYAAYPHLNDDAFVAANLQRWLE